MELVRSLGGKEPLFQHFMESLLADEQIPVTWTDQDISHAVEVLEKHLGVNKVHDVSTKFKSSRFMAHYAHSKRLAWIAVGTACRTLSATVLDEDGILYSGCLMLGMTMILLTARYFYVA